MLYTNIFLNKYIYVIFILILIILYLYTDRYCYNIIYKIVYYPIDIYYFDLEKIKKLN